MAVAMERGIERPNGQPAAFRNPRIVDIASVAIGGLEIQGAFQFVAPAVSVANLVAAGYGEGEGVLGSVAFLGNVAVIVGITFVFN